MLHTDPMLNVKRTYTPIDIGSLLNCNSNQRFKIK